MFDGAKKELTSKIIELLHPQWMEGTAKSCSWYLFASLICKISTQVSWAWSMESAELFSAQSQAPVPILWETGLSWREGDVKE